MNARLAVLSTGTLGLLLGAAARIGSDERAPGPSAQRYELIRDESLAIAYGELGGGRMSSAASTIELDAKGRFIERDFVRSLAGGVWMEARDVHSVVGGYAWVNGRFLVLFQSKDHSVDVVDAFRVTQDLVELSTGGRANRRYRAVH